ncbi:MAG: hypothetical protein A2030_02230 [Chloroflexi bacterium RBG_19FT_COMBO_50_10]|nr:MAG: hypothetical protein A2030_02230 [Chloroflexi bacterium RBG_19FT_COMBO_50_10]
MSGHKRTTITLSQEEYRKLHEAEMRLRFMNERVPNIIEETRNEISEQLQTDLEDMQFRQAALLESLDQVNLDISNMEQNTSQVLLDQQHALHQGIAEVVSDYHVETETALASLESQVQSQLQDLIVNHHHEWSWMANEWQRQANGQQQKNQLAREWLQAAAILDQFIIENYDHTHFTPGAVERYESRLLQAHDNLAHNLAEAAVTAAQEAYNHFSELRIELEKRQAEYQLLMQRVNLEARKLHEQFRANLNVPAIDLDGNPLPFNITVDFWANGELKRLEQEFEGVMTELVDSAQPAPADSLRELVDEYFPCVGDKIAEFVFNARMKVINAQLRMNIAEIVVQALSGQGYALDTSYFLTGDEREPYQANLTNYEGSQIVIKVDPIPDLEGGNELHLYTSDAQDKTSHELKQRALEIRRALQSSGLDVGTITANRSPADPAIFQTGSNLMPGKSTKRDKNRKDTIQKYKEQEELRLEK